MVSGLAFEFFASEVDDRMRRRCVSAATLDFQKSEGIKGMLIGTLFAFMVVGTLFWGSNLGWKQVLVFWAAYLCGGLIFSLLFHAPHFAAIYMSVVAIWFVGKAATSHTSML